VSYAINCRGLFKRYGDVTAVAGLDLQVETGECFGLLGPNGAGKTTTIEILEGLNEPTAGDVQVLGRRWATDERWLRNRLGISLQETHLQERLTVAETLRLFRSFYDRGRDVDELIALVSLEDKRDTWYVKLSGGQKQRLAVACALAGDPELLFLDEPTTGLDPQSRRQLWELVINYKRQGHSVLLTTHYMDEAERLCDRVGIVDHGKMIALGTPRELIATLGGQEVIELAVDGELAAAELARLPGVKHVHPSTGARGGSTADEAQAAEAPELGEPKDGAPTGWALTVGELHVTLPRLLELVHARGLGLTRLSTHHATLEDVFVSLTGRQLRD
jgi:ABC-2 type transport system ATP-binding protein